MPFEAEEGFILGGERPITQCKFLRAWERINKTICLYGATPHILRHSFITAAVPYVDVKTLQGIAGHADISTTLNRYAHRQMDRIMAAGEALQGMYGGENAPALHQTACASNLYESTVQRIL